nr:hypothetical protein [Tanacetum cinerariifolium]
MYDIDIEPLPPRYRNNREVHLDYLKHLKEYVETLREIIEEAKVERPLDRSLASACLYTKHYQDLLEYVKHVEQLNIQKTNVLVIPSTGVNSCTDASGSKPRSNTKKYRIYLILLKLNLPDHMSILTDSKIHIKMEMEVPGSS